MKYIKIPTQQSSTEWLCELTIEMINIEAGVNILLPDGSINKTPQPYPLYKYNDVTYQPKTNHGYIFYNDDDDGFDSFIQLAIKLTLNTYMAKLPHFGEIYQPVEDILQGTYTTVMKQKNTFDCLRIITTNSVSRDLSTAFTWKTIKYLSNNILFSPDVMLSAIFLDKYDMYKFNSHDIIYRWPSLLDTDIPFITRLDTPVYVNDIFGISMIERKYPHKFNDYTNVINGEITYEQALNIIETISNPNTTEQWFNMPPSQDIVPSQYIVLSQDIVPSQYIGPPRLQPVTTSRNITKNGTALKNKYYKQKAIEKLYKCKSCGEQLYDWFYILINGNSSSILHVNPLCKACLTQITSNELYYVKRVLLVKHQQTFHNVFTKFIIDKTDMVLDAATIYNIAKVVSESRDKYASISHNDVIKVENLSYNQLVVPLYLINTNITFEALEELRGLQPGIVIPYIN